MDFEKFKRLFLQVLIACLVGAAGLSVITVLTGSFNHVFGEALATILLVALHSLISFGFILDSEKRKTAESMEFFTNAVFVVIVLSFITSIFLVWGLMDGTLGWQLYLTYFVLLFAILHAEMLSKMLNKLASIDNLVFWNFAFMFVVVLMILPVIFIGETQSLGEVYYRFLAAFGIVDATLTLVAVILHRLYLQKHPKVKSVAFTTIPGQPGVVGGQNSQVPAEPPKRHTSVLLIILLVLIGLQFVGGLVVVVLGRIFAGG